MFLYDKKVDQWSKEMIGRLTEVWGLEIEKSDKSQLITRDFLLDYLSGYFKTNQKKIFIIFNQIFNSNYKAEDFKYFINSTGVSLHNTEESFISIGIAHSFSSYPTVIIHELFHILFYNYLNSDRFLSFHAIATVQELLAEGEINELKEIITVIINEEFLDLIDSFDKGYPEHEKMRVEALEIWRKEKDFDKFIQKIINVYKKATLGGVA